MRSSLGDVVHEMPWTDHAGIAGRYTGRVNARMQPHGKGALIYKDGTATTCIWKNGLPAEFWTPRRKHVPETKRSREITTSVKYDTFLPRLHLGDAAAPTDMLLHFDPDRVSSLQNHDFAFILRSDKRWAYAIVADRKDYQITFVIDIEGNTKVISRNRWLDSIRPVNCGGNGIRVIQPPPKPASQVNDEISVHTIDCMQHPRFESQHGDCDSDSSVHLIRSISWMKSRV